MLIVDDNVEAAQSLAELLRLKGHRVEIAYEGIAALRLADGFRPQVAIVDLKMPGIDGWELARRLRANPATGKTLLVALSGLARRATSTARTGPASTCISPSRRIRIKSCRSSPTAATRYRRTSWIAPQRNGNDGGGAPH
jgi:CheY-like chemotaxis protein